MTSRQPIKVEDLQSVLLDWDNEQLTDGACIDDLLELIAPAYPELWELILSSTDEAEDSYMTDYEAILYIINYLEDLT